MENYRKMGFSTFQRRRRAPSPSSSSDDDDDEEEEEDSSDGSNPSSDDSEEDEHDDEAPKKTRKCYKDSKGKKIKTTVKQNAPHDDFYEEKGAKLAHRKQLDHHLDELVEIVEINTFDPEKVTLMDINEKLNVVLKTMSMSICL